MLAVIVYKLVKEDAKTTEEWNWLMKIGIGGVGTVLGVMEWDGRVVASTFRCSDFFLRLSSDVLRPLPYRNHQGNAATRFEMSLLQSCIQDAL